MFCVVRWKESWIRLSGLIQRTKCHVRSPPRMWCCRCLRQSVCISQGNRKSLLPASAAGIEWMVILIPADDGIRRQATAGDFSAFQLLYSRHFLMSRFVSSMPPSPNPCAAYHMEAIKLPGISKLAVVHDCVYIHGRRWPAIPSGVYPSLAPCAACNRLQAPLCLWTG